MGLSFHCLAVSSTRSISRASCTSGLTSSQYLTRISPERTSIRSSSGASRKNSSTSASSQKPMTRSTPARLYQLRSNRTISPALGMRSM